MRQKEGKFVSLPPWPGCARRTPRETPPSFPGSKYQTRPLCIKHEIKRFHKNFSCNTELYCKAHALTLTHNKGMEHSGDWSYQECSFTHPISQLHRTHDCSMEDSSQTTPHHAGPGTCPPCKGCWLAHSAPSAQGAECFWIAVRVCGCGKERARDRAWAKGEFEGMLQKKKGNWENQNQARVALIGYYRRTGCQFWTLRSSTALAWKDVTEQVFSILTRRPSSSLKATASYTQVFKILTHNTGRKVFQSQKRLHFQLLKYIFT